MKIVLPTYKSIGWIVMAYAHLHEKYWGAPVVLLAEDDYSQGQFEFVRPPEGLQDSSGEIHAGHFTDVLIWYLDQIEDVHVIIMFADYLIYKSVDKVRLLQLEEYMLLHDNILRGQVGDDGGYCSGSKTDVYEDIAIWEGNFLPTSLTPGMWNRSLFLQMVKPNDTPWGVELNGRGTFIQQGWRSIAPAPGCVSYINALRGRNMDDIVMTEELYREVGHFLQIQPRAFMSVPPGWPRVET